MKVLFIGDVTGTPGLLYLRQVLPGLAAKTKPDLVVANGENAGSAGRGITRALAEELYDAGVEMITLGNHAWDLRDAYDLCREDERVVRPANFHPSAPGVGYRLCRVDGRSVAVVNLIGRTFMGLFDCPFGVGDRIIREVRKETPIVVIDFHAEATSEKLAFAWHVAGKVSAVVGTHTHVQTADERILPGGTAYITDVGMTGPRDGILGVKRDQVIKRFIDQMPTRFEVAEGPRQFSGVWLEIDNDTGRATQIERILVTEGERHV